MNYDLDESKIDYISGKLSEYKNDLWLLSWALLSYKPEYTHIDKIDIYNKVRNSILHIQGRNGMIDASNIFFVLSIFSRFEIPLEKGFLVNLGVGSNQIDELISLREILEDNRNGAISIVHSSIADIYFHTYSSFPELGRSIRSNYNGDESYLLFRDYLITKPFNFFSLFIQLCRDSVTERDGQTLAKRLLDDPLIINEFSKLIGENNELSNVSLSLGKLNNIDNKLIKQITDNINIEKLIYKLNQGSNFDISIFILLIKGINLPLVKNVIKRLDIRRIADKLKDENVYNILATLMAFFNVDSNVASDLVSKMIDKENIKRFLEIMLNEGSIFTNSLIVYYISYVNKDVAMELINELNINLIAENLKSNDDFLGFHNFLMISNLSSIKGKRISIDITQTGLDKIIIHLVEKDTVENAHFIMSLVIANKKNAYELINNKNYMRHLLDLIGNEKNLEEIGDLIIWITTVDRKIAAEIIKSVHTNIILEKIQHAEKIEDIQIFLIGLVYIDLSLAIEYYVFSIAYANMSLAFQLIKEMQGDAPHINIEKFLYGLLKELKGVLSLSLFTEYMCLDQVRDKWTMSFHKK
jgi:hypothetical protein